MKKPSISKFILLTICLVFIGYSAISYSSGSPGQRNGAPSANGNTCATSGCHTGGSVTNETVTISTDIPATGFVPNTEYTITITGDNGGGFSSQAGFEASIESNSTYMGTLNSAFNGTKLISSGKLITHNAKASITSGSVEWKFKWNSGTSPDGTKIYAVVNFVNNNGSPTGDVVVANNITLTKNTIGLEELWVDNINVFPNPASNEINITADFNQDALTKIILFDMSGKEVKTLYYNKTYTGFAENFDISDLNSGTYLLSLVSDGNVKHQKITIN